MAAQSAARHHPGLALFCQVLCQRGQGKKAALVAVTRKLLLQLNAVARRGAPWAGEYVPALRFRENRLKLPLMASLVHAFFLHLLTPSRQLRSKA